MTNITADMIKQLREKTGAGMMDCKKALTSSNGDFAKAEDWLKEKGLSVASKKADRVAAEGLVAVNIKDSKGVVIEVNSETDFVSGNQDFVDFVTTTSKLAINVSSLDELKAAKYDHNQTVEEKLVSLVGKIQENLIIRKFNKLNADSGKLYSYVHGGEKPGIGRIGVLLNLEAEGNVEEFGKKLCMHIAAMAPKALTPEMLDPNLIERERKVQENIVAESKKPLNIQEKMLEGKMNKFFQEVCLLQQKFVMDDSKSVAEVLKDHKATIISYIRTELGEGIEKKEEDFAAEVAKVINE